MILIHTFGLKKSNKAVIRGMTNDSIARSAVIKQLLCL